MQSTLLLVFGYQELLIILVIVLVLFGATRVPQLMRGLGQGVKEFRGALKEEEKPADAAEGETEDKPEE